MIVNTNEKSGLTVDILRHHDDRYEDGFIDSSLHGISYDCHEVTLLPSPDFPDVPELFRSTIKALPVVMVKRSIYGKEYLTAYPSDHYGNILEGSFAFGGTFIYCSDSRFPGKYPVPLHDRDLAKEKQYRH